MCAWGVSASTQGGEGGWNLLPSALFILRTPSARSKQAFAVRQGEREQGCLWQMEAIRVSLFHVFCGRNFSLLLSNRGKRCQRVRDEVSMVFVKLHRYIYIYRERERERESI